MWIACKDKMPENLLRVITYCDGKVFPGWYDEAEDAWEVPEIDDGYFIEKERVTHWQACAHLPPPPSQEK